MVPLSFSMFARRVIVAGGLTMTAGHPTMASGTPFFHFSFYCKPPKKQEGLHEMYEILREMHPRQIDTIEFRNYD